MSDIAKFVGVAILVVAAGIAGILIFNGLWYRVGFGAAVVVIVGGLLLVAWRADKRSASAYADEV
jgi:asparagine N-glycosylation enzyme membrane subunit Stt3